MKRSRLTLTGGLGREIPTCRYSQTVGVSATLGCWEVGGRARSRPLVVTRKELHRT